MDELGIWCQEAGGFIDADLYTEQKADKLLAERRDEYTAAGADPDDLSVKAICPDHSEQPKDDCQECEGDDEG